MKLDTTDQSRADLMVGLGPQDHVQGPVGAAITLVEYGDYECPYSGEAVPDIQAMQKKLGDRLCFVYRHFPLVHAHRHAFGAAEAAEAAGAQGRFWEMHQILFENQDSLTYDDLLEYAMDLGLNMSRFSREIRSGTYAEHIREDVASGAESGVDGTPSFFLNSIYYNDTDSLIEALQRLKNRG